MGRSLKNKNKKQTNCEGIVCAVKYGANHNRKRKQNNVPKQTLGISGEVQTLSDLIF